MYKFVVTHQGLVDNVLLLACLIALAFIVLYLWPKVTLAFRDMRIDPMVGTRYAKSHLDRI